MKFIQLYRVNRPLRIPKMFVDVKMLRSRRTRTLNVYDAPIWMIWRTFQLSFFRDSSSCWASRTSTWHCGSSELLCSRELDIRSWVWNLCKFCFVCRREDTNRRISVVVIYRLSIGLRCLSSTSASTSDLLFHLLPNYALHDRRFDRCFLPHLKKKLRILYNCSINCFSSPPKQLPSNSQLNKINTRKNI